MRKVHPSFTFPTFQKVCARTVCFAKGWFSRMTFCPVWPPRSRMKNKDLKTGRRWELEEETKLDTAWKVVVHSFYWHSMSIHCTHQHLIEKRTIHIYTLCTNTHIRNMAFGKNGVYTEAETRNLFPARLLKRQRKTSRLNIIRSVREKAPRSL